MDHRLINIILNKFQAFAAATPVPTVPGQQTLGELKGIGPLGGGDDYPPLTNQYTAVGLFSKIISYAIGIMTIVAFIWFLFLLLIGAIGWMMAGGDKAKTQNAQKQITNGVIGLVIVVTAIFLVRLIGQILGVEFLDVYTQILGLTF